MDRFRWTLLAMTVAALALRLLGLDSESLWLDESVSIQDARAESLAGVWKQVAENERQPPLFFWLLHLWGADGSNAFRLRLLSLLLGIGAVPLTGLLARRWVTPTGALWAAALVGASQVHYFVSQQLRPYGLAMTLAVLSTWLLVRFLERPDARRGIAYVAGASAALFTAYHLVLLVAVQCLALATVAARRRCPRRALALPVGIALVAAPLIALLIAQAEVGRLQWLQPPGVTTPYLVLLHFSSGVNLFRTLPSWAFLPTVGLAVFCLVRTMAFRGEGLRVRWLYGLWFVPVLLAFVISYCGRPIMLDGSRYVTFVVPFFLLTLVVGLESLPRRVATVTGSVYVILMLIFCVVTMQTPQRRPWTEAVELIRTRGTPGELVLTQPPQSATVLHVYLGEEFQVDHADRAYFDETFTERMRGRRSLWLLTLSREITGVELSLRKHMAAEEVVLSDTDLYLRAVHYRLREK